MKLQKHKISQFHIGDVRYGIGGKKVPKFITPIPGQKHYTQILGKITKVSQTLFISMLGCYLPLVDRAMFNVCLRNRIELNSQTVTLISHLYKQIYVLIPVMIIYNIKVWSLTSLKRKSDNQGNPHR